MAVSDWSTQTANEEQTRRLGALLAAVAEEGDVVLLNGSLGAGKTRFAQGVAAGLGIVRPVTSPTFGLLNVYTDGRLPLYHFDLYRLETEDDLESIDFFATVEGKGLSLIEWANLFAEAMPRDSLALTFKRDDEHRQGSDGAAMPLTIIAQASGPRSALLLSRWKAFER